MRLKPEQLPARLKQKPLDAVYLVSGAEPLQHMECCDAIRAAARAQGFSERQVLEVDKGFDWNSLAQEAAAMSLFAEQRLIELRLGGGPGNEGGKVLTEYCGQLPADAVLLISMGKLDGRSRQSKWYKAVDQAGVTIGVWPVDMARLPDWIRARCRQRNLTIEPEAAELIAQCVEGNLLAAAQEIEKLSLLAAGQDRIDTAAVIAAVADSARYDAFTMIQTAYEGELTRALRMLRGLHTEGVEAIAVYGALMWQLRRTCSLAHARARGEAEDSLMRRFNIFDDRKAAFRRLLKRHSPENLDRLLHTAGRIDGSLKGYRTDDHGGDPWLALAWLLAGLAGYDSLPSSSRVRKQS